MLVCREAQAWRGIFSGGHRGSWRRWPAQSLLLPHLLQVSVVSGGRASAGWRRGWPWNPWRAPSEGIWTVWRFGEPGHGSGNQSRICPPHRAPQPLVKDAHCCYEGHETRCVPYLLALVSPSSLSLSQVFLSFGCPTQQVGS